LAILFDGAEVPDTEYRHLQGTFRGRHVSIYEASSTAFQNMFLLPVVEFPLLIVPASLFAIYTTVKQYREMRSDSGAVLWFVFRFCYILAIVCFDGTDNVRREMHNLVPKFQVAWNNYQSNVTRRSV